ncbi:MAG: cyanoexosortase A [Cyanobacteria bacterium QH_2_48_84]|nr:MAG: cyanoexosortase A [Cyanobacteria bacterium QH_2_48_84]
MKVTKATHSTQLKSLIDSRFWLLGIAAGLIAIHLTLTWRADDSNLLSSSFLFWLAAGWLVWEKRDSLNFQSGLFSSLAGILLIAIVAIRSVSLPSINFLNASPFISALGLALLASGIGGLKQYWRELTILFALGIPKVLLAPLIETKIALWTAQFSTFLLWYTGFDISREGRFLYMPTGAVEVDTACSGVQSAFQLLSIAVLVLVMFPTNGVKRIFIPILAFLLAFVVNTFRVVLMALLAVSQNEGAFHFWHEGEGSLIFSVISVLLFGLLYFGLLQQADGENQDAEKL